MGLPVTIRHRRSTLERSLPRCLYYSTNEDKAKKLVHIKKTKRKILAIRRVFVHEINHIQNIPNKDDLYIRLVDQFRRTESALEERYTEVVLSPRDVLVWPLQ